VQERRASSREILGHGVKSREDQRLTVLLLIIAVVCWRECGWVVQLLLRFRETWFFGSCWRSDYIITSLDSPKTSPCQKVKNNYSLNALVYRASMWVCSLAQICSLWIVPQYLPPLFITLLQGNQAPAGSVNTLCLLAVNYNRLWIVCRILIRYHLPGAEEQNMNVPFYARLRETNVENQKKERAKNLISSTRHEERSRPAELVDFRALLAFRQTRHTDYFRLLPPRIIKAIKALSSRRLVDNCTLLAYAPNRVDLKLRWCENQLMRFDIQ